MTSTINLLGAILWCTVLTHSLIVPLVVPISTTCHNNGCQHVPSSTIIEGPFLLAALNGKSVETTKGFYPDKVIRILDANTIKLEKNGIVSMAGARMPTVGANFQFPDCLSYSPTYKLRQLIPVGTSVLVKIAGESKPQAVVVRSEDSLFVNEELVRTGFAKTKAITNPDLEPYLRNLRELQENAQDKGLGIFKRCETSQEEASFVAEFEPLEFDVETQWGDDGGKQIVRKKEDTQVVIPKNPGDIRGMYKSSLHCF